MPGADPIEHVVVVMLENHSFDRMLGSLRSVEAAVDGVDPNALRGRVVSSTSAVAIIRHRRRRAGSISTLATTSMT